MQPSQVSLPGSEYGIDIPEECAKHARLFLNRKALLAHCSASLPAKPSVVEVGVFQGYFSEHLLQTLAPSSLHLIDTFAVNDHITHLFTSATHLAHILAKFGARSGVHVHQGLSWEALAALPDASLDFAYIDADHEYQAVCNDISAVLPKMRHNGIIQFNDYTRFTHEGAPYGVMDAVNEFMQQHRPEVIGLSLDRSGYHDLAVRVNTRKLTIVTPCSRPENLPKIFETMRFDLIDKWYIIYDTRNATFVERYADHPQIVEMECKDEGVVGHPIRNMALDVITEGLVYFLDDDNTIHPEFWEMCRSFTPGRIHTFDIEYADKRVLAGDSVKVCSIDTAQYVFDVALVGTTRFIPTEYAADGMFIEAVWEANKDKWVYRKQVAAYYNRLR